MSQKTLTDKNGIDWVKVGDSYVRQGKVINKWWLSENKVYTKIKTNGTNTTRTVKE